MRSVDQTADLIHEYDDAVRKRESCAESLLDQGSPQAIHQWRAAGQVAEAARMNLVSGVDNMVDTWVLQQDAYVALRTRRTLTVVDHPSVPDRQFLGFSKYCRNGRAWKARKRRRLLQLRHALDMLVDEAR